MSIPKQRILIFSEFFYPSQTSTAYYISNIANKIATSCNRPVHVYCATPSNGAQDIYASTHNLFVHRIDKGNGDKNHLLARVLKFIRITLRFCFSIIAMARSNDIVFSVTNPAFFIPICAFLKKILHYKFILLAYDIFPENLVAAGLISEKSILHIIGKTVFDWGYRKADIVISIGRDMTEILKQKGVSDEKIKLIQNWADIEAINHLPKDDNPIIKQYNLEKKTVFMYAGNFGRVQGIPELLKVIDQVSADNAAFLFIGDGAMRGTIEDYQKKHPQKAVFCHPYLPMDQQNVFLNACDVAIATLNQKMFGLGVPSKSYYSLASGHPVMFIGDKRSEVAQMLQESQCGWQSSFDNLDDCVRLIDSICSLSREKLLGMGFQARDYLRDNFSKTITLDKYVDLFST